MSDSFATQGSVARQAPLLFGISQQEHWRRLPFPSPEDLPNPGIEPASPALAGTFFTPEPPGNPNKKFTRCFLCTKHCARETEQYISQSPSRAQHTYSVCACFMANKE